MKLQNLYPLAAIIASTTFVSAENFAPIGELSIDSALVRAGVKPILSWNISSPSSTVADVVTIENNDSIITKDEVRMNVRMLGASFYDGATVDFQIKIGNGRWERAFYGADSAIAPSEVVYSANVNSGTEVNFAGSGLNPNTNSWTDSRNTLTENLNIIALKDGDYLPTYAPDFNQAGIEDHVSAYVQNGKIALGSRDVIYLIEIGQTDTKSSGFDMQDLVVVVTFDESSTETKTTNTSADGKTTATSQKRRTRRR